MVTPEYPWGWKGDDASFAGTDTPSNNGTTSYDFVLVGAAQVWIWVWLVIGIIYDVVLRRR
jgi:hypothetical protein